MGAEPGAFYDTTRFWQWMRLPRDVVFSIGGLIMGWDFIAKLMRPTGAADAPQTRAAAVPAE